MVHLFFSKVNFPSVNTLVFNLRSGNPKKMSLIMLVKMAEMAEMADGRWPRYGRDMADGPDMADG